ncbi:MAG: DNA-binding response regulator [Calditrichaeota bacterium]|nr:MAG: DNA-binding response regulator [Calditrichota bacterium]
MDYKKILIVEDDPEIAELLEINLSDVGYRVEKARDGIEGLNKALTNEYDLIILDLMLPKLDGYDVCKRIREEKRTTPILMLTSKSEEFDKVLGLELGADDYITKPFSIRELIARVKALIRRVDAVKQEASNESQESEIKIGELVINLEKRKVTLGGEVVELTAKEFDLLALFASHPGRAYSRQELLDIVWGYQFDGYDHTVNSHINRLRSKIEKDPANPTYIKTVWGVGYRFVEPEEIGE